MGTLRKSNGGAQYNSVSRQYSRDYSMEFKNGAGGGGSARNSATAALYKSEGCCNIYFLKYCLYIFNFVFWVSGLGILGVALWTIFYKHHYVSLLTTMTYYATTYLLLGTGAVICLVGILGCCGAWRDNRLFLMAYSCFLLLIFLVEAIAGAIAYLHESNIHDELVRGLNHTMLNSFMLDNDRTQAINQMQRTFKCCGAGSFADWRHSQWLKLNSDIKNTAPDSCCRSESLGCAVRDHPSNIYYKGCIISLELHLREHLIILGAVGVGICFLQIFGIVLACCLAKKLKDYNATYSTNLSYWR